ncbi:Uncharacterised protein [Escherichia coli]|uniref:Uncharacterized protein n=1 Tax=Escherichia coli TaxID=562 RepID=A0A376U2Z5_ECOLX|nr:Uncharacterised protein [Escherichia coli]
MHFLQDVVVPEKAKMEKGMSESLPSDPQWINSGPITLDRPKANAIVQKPALKWAKYF